MISHVIVIHNRKENLSIYITDRMVGHKLGEFAPLNFWGHAKKIINLVVNSLIINKY